MIGRLAADPTLRENKGGSFCDFLLFCNQGKDRTGKEVTLKQACTVSGKLAEQIAQSEYFVKGRRVIVRGDLKPDVWVGRDGNTREGTKLWLDHSPELIDPKLSRRDLSDFPAEFGGEVSDFDF